MIQFDEHIFQMGWNHQPENCFEATTNPTSDFRILQELKFFNLGSVPSSEGLSKKVKVVNEVAGGVQGWNQR